MWGDGLGCAGLSVLFEFKVLLLESISNTSSSSSVGIPATEVSESMLALLPLRVVRGSPEPQVRSASTVDNLGYTATRIDASSFLIMGR